MHNLFPYKKTSDLAIQFATAAWSAGRRNEWPETEDYQALENELGTQPGETERFVFTAAWHGYMVACLVPNAEEALEKVKADVPEVKLRSV